MDSKTGDEAAEIKLRFKSTYTCKTLRHNAFLKRLFLLDSIVTVTYTKRCSDCTAMVDLNPGQDKPTYIKHTIKVLQVS